MTTLFDAIDPPPATLSPGSHISSVSLHVLASSSGGNCSALRIQRRDGTATLILIDLGLSPRRTRAFLALAGLGDTPIAAVVLTHLDVDHAYPGWFGKVPPQTRVHMHRRHLGRGEREGLLLRTAVEPFEGKFEPVPGVYFRPFLAGHDSLGVAVFRVEFTGCSSTLGYATDVGKPSDALAAHLSSVDVLAIESNYCPRLQLASDRPPFLKQRIMGGNGHLSNEQCIELTRRVLPRREVVLLHLSRQCNEPLLAASYHLGSTYRLSIAAHDGPIAGVPVVQETSRVPSESDTRAHVGV